MKIEQSLKYIISKSEVPKLISDLNVLDAKILMNNKLMIRTLFEYKNQNKGKWVRIREGDVTPYNEEICVITFKKFIDTFYGPRESVISVLVGDYDSAIELLQELGLNKKSIQENRRSKYICEYTNDNYIVCIDEWPELDDVRFITVQSISTVEHESLIEFAQMLGLARRKQNTKGVDAIYIEKLGYSASDKSELFFSLIDKKSTKR